MPEGQIRPHIGGSFGESWRGLHTGWGYRQPTGSTIVSFPLKKAILKPRPPFRNGNGKRNGRKYKIPDMENGLTLQNGGTGTGQPVLVHAGEMVIKNPFRRHGGRTPP